MLKLIMAVALLCVTHGSLADETSETSKEGVSVPAKATNLFEILLKESNLTFTAPQGFSETALDANSVMHYEHGVKHQTKTLELRYVIRPLKRLQVDYVDPHNAAPEPNRIPLVLASESKNVSSSSLSCNALYCVTNSSTCDTSGSTVLSTVTVTCSVVAPLT